MIEDLERRNFQRLIMDAEATVTRSPSERAEAVRLVNLSASGCAFTTHGAFVPGDSVVVLITSPTEGIEPFRRLARVTRSASLGPMQGQRVAVEFIAESLDQDAAGPVGDLPWS